MQRFKQRTDIVGKVVDKTNKINRLFTLTRNIAYNSPYGKIRHGAIIIKGGSVLIRPRPRFNCWI